eukprot:IDg4251t1
MNTKLITPLTKTAFVWNQKREVNKLRIFKPGCDFCQVYDGYLNPSSACSDKSSQLSTGTSACSGRSQVPLVALRCSNRQMLAFLPRAGRALATAYATSNIFALTSIAH